MGWAWMRRAADLVAGYAPASALERAVDDDPELAAGLEWGRPRSGHPEGRVGDHVRQLLDEIERRGVAGERRAELRFLALVHDAFKYRVRNWLPKVGENHHAMRARRFAERYTDDERLLATIELHDRPYALWRKMRRRRRLDERRFEEMIARIPDPELFVTFIELDGSGEGKNPAPIRWLREEFERREVVARRGGGSARA
jgi:hypothetical protein